MTLKEVKKLLIRYFAEHFDNLKVMEFASQVSEKLGLKETENQIVIVHVPRETVKKGESSIEVFVKSQGIKLVIFDDRAKQALVFDDEPFSRDGTTDIQ